MLRSNSKQSEGIHAVKPEERKGKVAVGKDLQKRKLGIKPRMKESVGDGIPIIISMTVGR